MKKKSTPTAKVQDALARIHDAEYAAVPTIEQRLLIAERRADLLSNLADNDDPNDLTLFREQIAAVSSELWWIRKVLEIDGVRLTMPAPNDDQRADLKRRVRGGAR